MKIVLNYGDLDISEKVICTNISFVYGTIFVKYLNEYPTKHPHEEYQLRSDIYKPYKSSFEE